MFSTREGSRAGSMTCMMLLIKLGVRLDMALIVFGGRRGATEE